jgi:hypothetical protein
VASRGNKFCVIARKAQNAQCKSFVENAEQGSRMLIFTTKALPLPET